MLNFDCQSFAAVSFCWASLFGWNMIWKSGDWQTDFLAPARKSMGLNYHFKITAPAERSAEELERFLKSVEASAKEMGFDPTMVFDARFDSDERRSFAKRLTRGLVLENDKLKGLALPAIDQVWNHNPVEGYCRVIPERGVVLVVTDERKCESAFGFFQYPSAVVDANQRVVRGGVKVAENWRFEIPF